MAGLGQLTIGHQELAEIEIGGFVSVVQGDRLFETSRRLPAAPCPDENTAQIVVALRVGRIRGNRLADHALTSRAVSRLMLKQAQQPQGVWIIGVKVKQALIKRLGLLQRPGAVVFDRRLDALRHSSLSRSNCLVDRI